MAVFSFCLLLFIGSELVGKQVEHRIPRFASSLFMSCPLCGEDLKQVLFLTTLAVVSCPSESCIYPFNLSMAELERQNLIIRVSEQVIMEKMQSKLKEAKIETKVANFITKPDDEITGI